jgi:serine/threonine-protein kinase
VPQQKVKTKGDQTSLVTGAGSVIPGYSILARVGRGGMGAVFKAIQLSMNRLVALKILPISLAKDRTYIRRFLREAKSAAQMNHPNLTRVYDVGSYRGVFYFSMEFVQGDTLLGLIKSEGKLGLQVAIDIALQAARGLRHAHSHSIVHRDIKPENIMIATDGSVKVTDMGLAKRTDTADHDITVTGQVIGTPCYMSPEQITDPKSVNGRSDIYSLGATFYHMVTGRRPFQGENTAQTMFMVVGEDPQWSRGEVPVPVLRVIKRMMAKDPARRYQTMDELISELIYLKERVFSPHRSRRLAFISALASPAPRGAPGDEAAAIIEAPSRKLTLILALATFAAVLLAVLLRPEVKASEVNPPPNLSFRQYFNTGMTLADTHQWHSAFAYFEAATDANRFNYDAWNNHGTCLYHLGRYEEAAKSFKEALILNPELVHGCYNLGRALLELKKPGEALEKFEDAIALEPQSWGAWWGKSVALRRLGRAAEARKAMAKAKELKQ